MASLAALLGASALLALPGHSEARSRQRDRILARALFKQAAKAFTEENYPAALQLFTESYQLVPKPVVLYNIAMCHRALFQYKESIAAFRKFLSKAGKRLSGAKRQRIDRLILEMTAKLVRLNLHIEPRGTVLKIDGQIVGSSPFEGPLTLNPGRHVFEAIATGYKTARKVLSFTDGERYSLKLQLQREIRYGFLVLSSPIRGASVQVTGRKPKLLPATLKLPEGQVSVRVMAPGHKAATLAVRIRPESVTQRSVRLEPVGPIDGGQDLVGRRAAALPEIRARGARRAGRNAVPPAAPRRPVPIYKRAWFWSVIGAVVVGAAVGGGIAAWRLLGTETPVDMSVSLR